ncbi:hyoscyamine 6-dioxygenase [Cladorrhinum sp. PSN332]|nr:hyoscyamine 6-dioxygenase [Cladorrhinum sp. PSN332]
MADTHDFTEIPVLNLALADDPSTRPKLLAQLHQALTQVGFLYITNHGVPDSVISDLTSLLPRRFALPQEEKDEIAIINSPHFLGYSGTGTETTAGNPDRREQFEFATELEPTWSKTNGLPLYERLYGPNQWPSNPIFRPHVLRYLDTITTLSLKFLDLATESLSLPPGSLHTFLSKQHRLKLIHYPSPSTNSSTNNIQGVGPHKDSSGWLTFLLQATPPHIKGLQALNRSGEWIDIPNKPGTLVVNIGQAFEVITHGKCKATVHRVVMDGEAAMKEARYSVAFFQGVRGDLTKDEAVGAFRGHFNGDITGNEGGKGGKPDGTEAEEVDSPFLRGKYETWGESQLRTKIRSHRDVGRRWYGDVVDKYLEDDV